MGTVRWGLNSLTLGVLVLSTMGCDTFVQRAEDWFATRQEEVSEIPAPNFLPEKPRQVHGLLPHAEIPEAAPFVGKEGVDKHGYPLKRPNRALLNRLLRAQRFDLLDGFLAEYQEEFEKEFKREYWVGDALNAFGDPDPVLLPILNKWVEQHPTSYAAFAARAYHYAAVGSHFRGADVAIKTSATQFSTQKEYLDRAIEDIKVAVRLRPRFTSGYIAWLRFAGAAGNGEAQLENLLKQALLSCPACVRPHAQRLYQLRPRWGGSYPTMERRAQAAQAKIAENSRLAHLLGMAGADRCSALIAFHSDVERARPHCERTLAFGYDPLLVEPVLQFYRFIKDEPRAAEIAGAVLELDPQNSLALNTRYESRAKAKKYKEAALDLIVLRQLDSTDALVGKQTQWLTDMLRYEGDQLRKGNQADEAAAYFQLGLELSPHDHDLRNRMAHADQGQIAQLLEIVSKNPSDYPMHIRLDGALAVQRRFPEIIEMWDRYIESNPQDARAYYERGGAKKYARRTDAAMDIKRACDMGMAAACDVVARFGLKKTQN